MSLTMTSRTKATLIAGFVVFVGGVSGAAYLGNRPTGAPADAGKVQALYAEGPVDAGTSGDSALAEGRIRAKAVAVAARPINAVGDPSQLSGLVSVVAIPAGSVVTTEMFAAPQTRIGTIVIPPGKRALTLELSPVPGVSGFVGAGDRIDVYAVAAEGSARQVRLVFQGVSVLNVNGAGLPSAQGQPGSGNLVYLLAVTPAEAERLIYLNAYEKLHFDLVPKDEGPVATPGALPAGAFVAG